MNEIISIIVPIYNAEKSLKRCVESLINQTYTDIEIILINDGSTDNSMKICKEYSVIDNRIQIVDIPNGGVSAARNKGLELSKGSFIMFCDSDDWAEKNWCEKLLENFEIDNLVMCSTYVEGNQNILPRIICPQEDMEKKDKKEFVSLKQKMFNVPWNKIYSKSIIEKYCIRFDENLSNGEDLLFNLQYLEKISGAITMISNCGYHYCWPTSNSLSRKVPDNYVEQCDYLFNKIRKIISGFGELSKENETSFYRDFYFEYQKVLLHVLMSDDRNIVQQWKTGNSIMQNKNYQICASKVDISSNKIFSFISRLKTCYALWIWCFLRK